MSIKIKLVSNAFNEGKVRYGFFVNNKLFVFSKGTNQYILKLDEQSGSNLPDCLFNKEHSYLVRRALNKQTKIIKETDFKIDVSKHEINKLICQKKNLP